MSEIITSGGTGLVFSDMNLTITSEGSLTIQLDPNASVPTVDVTGSLGGDFIAPLSLDDTTVFNVSGGDGSDTVQGAAGADTISGDAGDDILYGGEGNNNLKGGEGNDTAIDGSGQGLLEGGTGNDTIDGGGGNDALLGGEGNDKVVGGEGNDSLQGGSGVDTLIGGAGRDFFRFEKGSTGGTKKNQVDKVQDFRPQDDSIQFDRRLFKGALPSGKLDPDNFLEVKSLKSLQEQVKSGSMDSDTLKNKIVYETGSGLVYFSRNENNSTILVQLGKNLSITPKDFELFY